MYKFRTQNALFRYFSARTLKNYCHIWNQHPQICIFANFAKKQKCLNLGPKMLYLGIFWVGSLNYYCHIWNQHPQICLIAKFSKITKMLKFGTKNPFFFGYFWARIYKNCFHIWNKHPQICQNEYLSHTANFGIGSAFSKFLRSAFSEGPGPRLGPLYNLCLTLVWQKGSNLK